MTPVASIEPGSARGPVHIEIDRDRCQGHAVCVQSAPEIFELDEEGDPVLMRPAVTGVSSEAAALAERSCPMQAVRLT